MTLEQQAAELVAKWEHGDEAHRQWLRDMATPDVIAFANVVRQEAWREAMSAPTGGFWYLASPYSNYPDGKEAAWIVACQQAALLLKAGVRVYSPIAHTHPIAIHGGIDPSHAFPWLEFDAPLMEAAKGVIICRMDGWDVSHGVTREREAFEAASKPIVWMDPGIVPFELLPSTEE